MDEKKKTRRQVLIIGGGASGLVAAIAAAREGAKVTVLEKKSQVGKKILATGNGRCNLTNTNQNLSNYRCTEETFPVAALASFSHFDAIRFFGELGIFTKNKNGYLYPYSEQAAAVVEALRMEAEHLHVKMSCNTEILGIKKEKNRFLVETSGWTYEGDALILACGSKASPDGSEDGYGYAKSLGHKIVPVLPALVQLRTDKNWPQQLAGLRLDACVNLYVDGSCVASDTGEVQLTLYGVSGIPVFQVSRFAAKALHKGQKVEIGLAFLPLFTEAQLKTFLENRAAQNAYKTVEAFLVGLFPQKLIPVLTKNAKLSKGRLAGELSGEEMDRMITAIRDFRVPITKTNGFEQAQICTGGVDVTEIEPFTMESKVVPGLYVTGELLDVDGACGGYNLQWAWTSGYLAGKDAAS